MRPAPALLLVGWLTISACGGSRAGTANSGTATAPTSTSGTATSGTATSSTATSGTATSGTATSGSSPAQPGTTSGVGGGPTAGGTDGPPTPGSTGGAGTPDPSWPARPAACPTYTEATVAAGGGPLGTTPAALGEVSGMVAGRANPGLLWVHNDSGDRARLYLVGEDLGIRTTLDVPGVFALDWEAMSAGPGPGGTPWLWVADVGDNFLVRPFVELHGFPEPAFGTDPPAIAAATGVVTLRVRYPAEPLDVEAFTVDPRTGDGVLVAKTLDADGRAAVLRLPAAALREGGDVTAEAVGAVAVTNGDTGARAADTSADGTLVAVKDLTTTSIWLRGPGDDLATLLATQPEAPCRAELGRGEAMALSADGTSVWSVEEGVGRPLRRFTSTG